jgi:hypothetical protein
MSRTGGRAHPAATPEQESERYRAAERYAVLIERREELVTELSEIAIEMSACEEKVKAFD